MDKSVPEMTGSSLSMRPFRHSMGVHGMLRITHQWWRRIAAQVTERIGRASRRDRVKILAIDSEVGQQRCLHIKLAEDGSISRLGTELHEAADGQIYIGRTREPLFERVLALVSEELLSRSGSYAAPGQRRGKPCKLAIHFWGASGEPVAALEFLYGLDSQGPPAEILRLVREATEVTDPWLEQVRRPPRDTTTGRS